MIGFLIGSALVATVWAFSSRRRRKVTIRHPEEWSKLQRSTES